MREFNVSTGGVTLGSNVGPVTLVCLRTAAAPSINVEVLRWWVGQSANATSAQQRIHVAWKASAFATLVALTPVTLKLQDPNASVLVGSTTGAAGTAGINATAEGAGATAGVIEDAFNVLNGWLMVPTPPETMILPAGHGSGLIMRFPTQPASAASWSFGCQFREI